MKCARRTCNIWTQELKRSRGEAKTNCLIPKYEQCLRPSLDKLVEKGVEQLAKTKISKGGTARSLTAYDIGTCGKTSISYDYCKGRQLKSTKTRGN